MIAHGLGAVVPEGVLIHDSDGEDAIGLAGRGSKVEAGEDGIGAAERLAGLVKGRLDHSVVLGQEVPFDYVANLGDDVLRLEVKTAVGGGGTSEDSVNDARGPDLDLAGVERSWGSRAETQEGSGSEGDGGEGDHFD